MASPALTSPLRTSPLMPCAAISATVRRPLPRKNSARRCSGLSSAIGYERLPRRTELCLGLVERRRAAAVSHRPPSADTVPKDRPEPEQIRVSDRRVLEDVADDQAIGQH